MVNEQSSKSVLSNHFGGKEVSCGNASADMLRMAAGIAADAGGVYRYLRSKEGLGREAKESGRHESLHSSLSRGSCREQQLLSGSHDPARTTIRPGSCKDVSDKRSASSNSSSTSSSSKKNKKAKKRKKKEAKKEKKKLKKLNKRLKKDEKKERKRKQHEAAPGGASSDLRAKLPASGHAVDVLVGKGMAKDSVDAHARRELAAAAAEQRALAAKSRGIGSQPASVALQATSG
eukprot:TRINITY_DN43949_c0_g1_i1.p1 TRINITY_DN43949_c0_g1~~TRINITY_DN43949_c0_g1_i1.p1  ORF type:complete len:240 (+),score=67.35 TRINITY_DN43949_c0_g1_i1:23-721(+)